MKIEGQYQGMDPVITGVSKAGNQWQKTYFEIITNEGARARRLVFEAWGDVAEQVKTLPKGANIEVEFSAESRDYLDKNNQKRYSTDLNCYRLAVITKQTLRPQYAQPQYQQGQPAQPQYMPGQPAQFQQQTPPPTAYPPAPPAQGTAAQPQLQYDDSVSPFQQQPAASADELPPKNYGFPC